MQKIEEGAVTDSYKLDKDRSIEILNEALATEIVCVLRYQHHYFMATGVHGRGVADVFKEHADEEREHTDELAERIQQLGGKPNFNPGDLVQRSVSQYIEGESLSDMIREDLIAERVVIDVYQRMIEYFGMKDPTTRALLEHIKAEEEEHASELSDMLFIVDPRTGEDAGQDPGTDPLHMSERSGRDSGRSASRQTGTSPELREVESDDLEEQELKPAESWGNERNVGGRGKGSPNRRSLAPGETGWGNEENAGNVRRGARGQSKQKGRSDLERSVSVEDALAGMDKSSGTKDRKTNITNRSRDERVTPKAARGGNSTTGGRTMNRRQPAKAEIDSEDVAAKVARGASGTNRSPRVLQKNRKNKRAA